MAVYDTGKKLFNLLVGRRIRIWLEPLLRQVLRVVCYGSGHYCPCCQAGLRHFVAGGELCPACGSGKRQRLQWLYLDDILNLFSSAATVLDIAPMLWFQRYCLRRTRLRYHSLDHQLPWALERGDLTAAPYADECFQIVLCSHVLEHIPDDMQALGEIYRLLAPGGTALIAGFPLGGNFALRLARIFQQDFVPALLGTANLAS